MDINKVRLCILTPNPDYVEGGTQDRFLIQKIKPFLLKETGVVGQFDTQCVQTNILLPSNNEI